MPHFAFKYASLIYCQRNIAPSALAVPPVCSFHSFFLFFLIHCLFTGFELFFFVKLSSFSVHTIIKKSQYFRNMYSHSVCVICCLVSEAQIFLKLKKFPKKFNMENGNFWDVLAPLSNLARHRSKQRMQLRTMQFQCNHIPFNFLSSQMDS